MREIKFRAYGPTGMTFFDNEQAAHDQYIAHHLMLMMANKHPQGKDLLMQYTGLKDKNGVEIYEGDILTCKYPQMPEKYPPKIIVQWDEEWNGWSFKPRLITTHGFYVMGNIHENPELLENET